MLKFALCSISLEQIGGFCVIAYIYLVQKETQCFYLQFLGLKIIAFKNCFNSVVLHSSKNIDCLVVLNWILCSVQRVKF